MTILPLPAPDDPLPLVREWLEAAAGEQRNPDAMALATADRAGRPSVRMVLMRKLSLKRGFAVFYTHYGSRKGVELEHNGWGAGVIYWATLGRQVRFEGPVVRSPESESDTYFATRPWRSQLNAWVSAQSSPLPDPGELEHRARRKAVELGLADDGDQAPDETRLPRPSFWGGYRLWFRSVELWAEGVARFHDRIRYERALEPRDEFSFAPGPWSSQRLQP
jgi:pyridoxamine 5'-phosphate oxidase